MSGPNTSAAGLRRLGRYTILEDLAKGGMAQVFIAQKDNAPEICVLKQLLGELEAHATAGKRFYREAHVASYLTHRRIARTIDAGFEAGTFCIAMEFIAGRDVESMMHLLMRQGRMLPYELSLSVAIGVLEGLEYAHDAKDPEGAPLDLVHRDLSPRNVMLSFEGDVKVIDFGLARGKVDDFKTAPGMILGTLRYVSPEQAVADPIDRRSDLYSIAVVLYEMLTGRPLVRDGKALDVLTDVVQRVPELLSVRNPHLPPALDAVMAKALEKKPEDRFQSAQEMRLALEQAAGELARTPRAAIGEFVTGLFPKDKEKAHELLERGRRRHIELSRSKSVVDPNDRTLSPRDLTPPDDPGSRTRTGYVSPDELGSLTRTGISPDPLGSMTRTAFDPRIDPMSATRIGEPDQPMPTFVPSDTTRLTPYDDRTSAMDLGATRLVAGVPVEAPHGRSNKAMIAVAAALTLALGAGFWALVSSETNTVHMLAPASPSETAMPAPGIGARAVVAEASPRPSPESPESPPASPQASPTRKPSPPPTASPKRSAAPETAAASPAASRKPEAAPRSKGLQGQLRDLETKWDQLAPADRYQLVANLRSALLAAAPADVAQRINRMLDDNVLSGDERDIGRLKEALNLVEKISTP